MKTLEFVYGSISIVGIVLVIFYFIDMFQNFEPSKPPPPPPKYRFEAISLPDGTPCHVVKGGSFTGIVGITCNYRRVK